MRQALAGGRVRDGVGEAVRAAVVAVRGVAVAAIGIEGQGAIAGAAGQGVGQAATGGGAVIAGHAGIDDGHVFVGAGRVVSGAQVGDRIDRHSQGGGGAGRCGAAVYGNRSNGQVEGGVAVGWRSDGQAGELSRGQDDAAAADGQDVAGGVAEDGADWNVVEANAQGLAAVGVGQGGGDVQCDRAVFVTADGVCRQGWGVGNRVDAN